MRILLIEDDLRLADHTAEYLRDHGAKIEIANDGARGLELASEGDWDVVLLDLMLPELDGLTLCRMLRQHSRVPVIMLSARGEEIDRIVGLEIGADDYLPKPFSPRELLARIRAVLRRGAGAPEPERRIEIGPLLVDADRRVASLRDEEVDLTAYQFDLLWVLASQAGKVVRRADLFSETRRLRNESPVEFDPSIDRSIDVHLSKIRQALAKAIEGGDALIRTVRGVGYVVDVSELGGDATESS